MFTKNKQLTSTAVLATVLCTSSSLFAQSPALFAPSLPQHRVAEVGKAFTEARLGDAIRSALNSAGDTITLQVEANLSAAVIAFFNVGQTQKLQVEVKRTATGYEAAISHEDARTCGLELYQGLEFNAGLGTEKKVVFRFDDADVAASRLQTLAIARALKVANKIPQALSSYRGFASALASVEASFELVQKQLASAQTAYVNAASKLPTLSYEYRLAQQALERARSAYESGRSAYISARDALNAAKKALDESPLPDFLKGWLKDAVSAASSALNDAYDVYVRAVRAFNAAKTALNSAKAAYDDAYRTVQQGPALIQQLSIRIGQVSTQLAAARKDASAALALYQGLSYPKEILARHVGAVEFQLHRMADVSATLTIPGVNIGNLGAGIVIANKTGVKVRCENPLAQSGRRIVLSAIAELESKAFAGAFVGLDGRTKAKFGLHVSFVQNPPIYVYGRPLLSTYSYEKTETDAEIDLSVQAIAGIGWNVAHGVGRKIKIVMPESTWQRLIGAAPAFLQDPTLETLAAALRGATANIEVSDRWIAAGIFKFGGSLVGYGVNLGGAATWNDEGVQRTQTFDAGKLLAELHQEATQHSVLQQLANARR